MGPPRTPPRKRHHSKSSQSPRVSMGSSASSSSKAPRVPALRKLNAQSLKDVKDKGKDEKKNDKKDKVKDKVKDTVKDSKKDDKVKDNKKDGKKDKVKDLSKVKNDKLKKKKRVPVKEKDRGAEKEKKTKESMVEGMDTSKKCEKAESKSKEKVREVETNTAKGEPKKVEQTAKVETKEKPKKKEEKIEYVPCKRGKMDHLFKASSQSTRGLPSPTESVSSRERANAHLASLTKILEESDDDSFSSLDGTDLDQFAAVMEQAGSMGSSGVKDFGIEKPEGEPHEGSSQESGEEISEGSEEEQEEEDEEEGEEGEKKQSPTTEIGTKQPQTEVEDMEEESVAEGEEESDEEEDALVEGDGDGDGDGDHNEHALVPVTKETTVAVADIKTSATNKREWDAFMRQLKSNTRAPIALSEFATSHANKVDLFNMWLGSGKDWSQCELLVKRKQEKKNEGVKGWEAIQGRVLKTRYTTEKWEKLKESRKSSGLWYPDQDFPDDDDDPYLSKNQTTFLVSPQYWIS